MTAAANVFRAAMLVMSLAALTLGMSTYLDNRGHPWLNERIALLFGECPRTYVHTTAYDDVHGAWPIKETCEAP